jgi:uncharacterized protein (TIGR02271 family)
MARRVAGLFPGRAAAQQAIADLEAAGIEWGRIRVLAAESEPHEAPPLQHWARTTGGAVVGSLILGSIGAVIGWIAALVWPIHTLTSVTYAMVVIACVGGMIGWLVGALAPRRVDTEREEYHREQVQQGRTIVAVDADSRYGEVVQVLARDGAQPVPRVTLRQSVLPLFRSRRPARARRRADADGNYLTDEMRAACLPVARPLLKRTTGQVWLKDITNLAVRNERKIYRMLNENDQLQGDLAGQGNAPIVDGTPVYDAAGDKVGEVVEHNDQGAYLTVQQGWLFPKDVYIPYSAMRRKTTDGIYLSMTKDRLETQNWENPPGFAGDNRDVNVNNTSYAADQFGTDTGNATDMMATDTAASNLDSQTTSQRDGDVRGPVREEELTARKQPYEAGRVHVEHDVVEEQQNVNVPVTHEEVRAERVPVQGDASNLGPDAFSERDIDVPVMGEEIQIDKQARVNEELRLHKQPVTENRQVSDSVLDTPPLESGRFSG